MIITYVFGTQARRFDWGPELIASVATAVFAVSGAIIALALPAAQLSDQIIQRKANYALERYQRVADGDTIAAQGTPLAILRVNLLFLDEIRRAAKSALWGSASVFIAFMISACALFVPNQTLFADRVGVGSGLLGLAFGLLFWGTGSYFPLARLLYGTAAINDVAMTLQDEIERQQKSLLIWFTKNILNATTPELESENLDAPTFHQVPKVGAFDSFDMRTFMTLFHTDCPGFHLDITSEPVCRREMIETAFIAYRTDSGRVTHGPTQLTLPPRRGTLRLKLREGKVSECWLLFSDNSTQQPQSRVGPW